MDSYEALKEESSQIILYNIHTDQPVAEEGDAFRLLGRLDGDGKRLLSVIDKHGKLPGQAHLPEP